MVAGVFIAARMDSCFFSGKFFLRVCVAGPEGGRPLCGQQDCHHLQHILAPLQLGRREIFTAPCHKGFRQGMAWRMYRPSVLVPDPCLGRGPMDGVWVLFIERLADTGHSDFGRSCCSLAVMHDHEFWALYLHRSQNLGRDMEVCVPGHQALSGERALGWYRHSCDNCFHHPTTHYSQHYKSPEMTKIEKHSSPVQHIFENRKQANNRQIFSTFPLYLSFTHMQDLLLWREKSQRSLSLCHRKTIYEFKSKFTE